MGIWGGGWRVPASCSLCNDATARLPARAPLSSTPLHPPGDASLPARLPPPSGTTSHGSPVQRRTGAKYNREAPRLMSRPNKAKNRPLNNTRCNVGAAAKRGLARDAAERGMLRFLFPFKISRDAERIREREREGGGATCHERPLVPVSPLAGCSFVDFPANDPATRDDRRSKSRGIEMLRR